MVVVLLKPNRSCTVYQSFESKTNSFVIPAFDGNSSHILLDTVEHYLSTTIVLRVAAYAVLTKKRK